MTVIRGLVEAAECFSFGVPELFAGFSKAEFDPPVAYPPHCSPQAWSSAAACLLLKGLLGLQVLDGGREIRLKPILDRSVLPLEMEGMAMPGGPLSLRIDQEGVRVLEAPEGLRVIVQGD